MRARRMLESGQVDGALAEVARLPGRDKAAAWMTAARRYIQARRALDVLETAAIVEPQKAVAAAATLPPAVGYTLPRVAPAQAAPAPSPE
jgi:thioredoxin-like negative regulator of GroEL